MAKPIPYLSPDDEFADFETWDQGNITLGTDKEPEMLQYEYTRSGAGAKACATRPTLGNQPVQVWHYRQHRFPHRHGHDQ